jgi:hypothetical protein
MKRIFLITVIAIAVCFSSYARKLVAEGETYSALGKYKVELADKYVKINGFEHKPYVISFENSDLEARVFITMERGCRKYYVLSDDLSVQYVSTRNYFGVEKLDKQMEKEGYKTSDSDLNRREYFRQKAITPGNEWKKDKTTLIAAYFPMLLNNPENILASK